MKNDYIKDLLLEKISEIKGRSEPKRIKQLNVDLMERVIHRLSTYSNGCDECEEYLQGLEEKISNINDAAVQSRNNAITAYITNLKSITGHLQKKHGLVTEGYYTGVYMSIGIALGLPLGLVFSQSIGNMAFMSIGLPIGLCIGLSIGSSLDAKAKKEGLVI